jgi:hypothetical protein
MHLIGDKNNIRKWIVQAKRIKNEIKNHMHIFLNAQKKHPQKNAGAFYVHQNCHEKKRLYQYPSF